MTAILNTTQIQNATSTTPNITLDTAGNAQFGGMPYGGSSFLRNRIINGAMDFAQRGTSFSSPVTGSYTVDRWYIYAAGTTVASVAQVAGPTGYRYAAQMTGTAGNTQAALVQKIESYNCSDLSGQTITIQANISVSSAQTVLWQLLYPSAQDNWSSVTLITSGTWSATTTATTFTATITGLPSNATNGLSLNFFPQNGGAFTSGTITITGVQLERGTVATPFERRQYGHELALCQRYYQNYIYGASNSFAFGSYNSAGNYSTMPYSMPPMRVMPSLSIVGTWATSNIGTWGIGPSSNQQLIVFATANTLGPLYLNNPANGGFVLNAEL